jgi:sugar lactone lactonase YvrE
MSPIHVEMSVLGNLRCKVGESPLWSPAEMACYWVDIEGRAICRWRHGDAQVRCWTLPGRPGCIALAQDGGLVCAMEDQIVHVSLMGDGSIEARPLARLQHAQPGMRLNDGRADREGRFWVGSMVMDMALAAPAGKVYRWVAANEMPHSQEPIEHLHSLIVPNGLAFSPDGRTMYLSDSHPSVRRIWAFDLDEAGLPHRQRVFVDMHQHPGRPDGAAVDVDGCYWTCANDAGQIHRFTPDGRLDRSIQVPVSKPSMCAFGGSDMDELFITSIRPAQPQPHEADLAGATFVCRPGVRGLPETPVPVAWAT